MMRNVDIGRLLADNCCEGKSCCRNELARKVDAGDVRRARWAGSNGARVMIFIVVVVGAEVRSHVCWRRDVLFVRS